MDFHLKKKATRSIQNAKIGYLMKINIHLKKQESKIDLYNKILDRSYPSEKKTTYFNKNIQNLIPPNRI